MSAAWPFDVLLFLLAIGLSVYLQKHTKKAELQQVAAFGFLWMSAILGVLLLNTVI